MAGQGRAGHSRRNASVRAGETKLALSACSASCHLAHPSRAGLSSNAATGQALETWGGGVPQNRIKISKQPKQRRQEQHSQGKDPLVAASARAMRQPGRGGAAGCANPARYTGPGTCPGPRSSQIQATAMAHDSLRICGLSRPLTTPRCAAMHYIIHYRPRRRARGGAPARQTFSSIAMLPHELSNSSGSTGPGADATRDNDFAFKAVCMLISRHATRRDR